MRAVLADTGPLYAAADPSDRYHNQAQDEIERLGTSGLGVLVAYPTLFEAYTLVMRRLGIEAAHRWLAEVRAGATLVTPTPDDYLEAARRVATYPDQALTLFDVLLAILSQRLGVPVWTYDHHFDLMKARVWR